MPREVNAADAAEPTFPPLSVPMESWIALVLTELAHITPDHERQDTVLDRMRWVWRERVEEDRRLARLAAEQRRRTHDAE
jgi:hypothetical protein